MNRHDRRVLKASRLTLFILFRSEGWYPVEIPVDQLQANIDLNPGTIRVEDMQGNVVWAAHRTRAPGADGGETDRG